MKASPSYPLNKNLQLRTIINLKLRTGNKGTSTFRFRVGFAYDPSRSEGEGIKGGDKIDKIRGFHACTQGVPVPPSSLLSLIPPTLN